MAFKDLLNKYLQEHNAPPIAGISYEQFNICETKGVYCIFEQTQHVASTETLQQARELIDTINSGC